MAVGDIYQLLDFQRFLSQEVENVYFYRQTAEDALFPSAKALVDMWNSQVRIGLTNLQSTGLTHYRYQAINLFNPGELYDVLDSDAGSAVGDVANSFVAWGFAAPRTNRLIRASKRRLAGVIETDITNGAANSGALAKLNPLAVSFNAQLVNAVVGGSNVFVPVAVKRIPYTTEDGNPAYRLPESSAEAVFRIISNWGYERVTTQSSRKIGKGT